MELEGRFQTFNNILSCSIITSLVSYFSSSEVRVFVFFWIMKNTDTEYISRVLSILFTYIELNSLSKLLYFPLFLFLVLHSLSTFVFYVSPFIPLLRKLFRCFF